MDKQGPSPRGEALARSDWLEHKKTVIKGESFLMVRGIAKQKSKRFCFFVCKILFVLSNKDGEAISDEIRWTSRARPQEEKL